MLDEDAPDHFRLFIAIQVPDAVKDELERAQNELRRGLPNAAVRWTKRDQFHLTLRFLGDVAAQHSDAVGAAVRGVCQRFAALKLRAEAVGFFPNPRAPRVVWVGIRDAQDQLLPLQRAVQAATAPFTAQAPEDRFTGHVTLGRVKSLTGEQAADLAGLVAAMADRRFGEWTATGIEIMRSELFPQGARHECLAAVGLGGQETTGG